MPAYKNLRITVDTHRELLKLKSLESVAKERDVTFDEVLRDMIGYYQPIVQDLIRGVKVVRES